MRDHMLVFLVWGGDNMQPEVSVFVPTYNHRDYIAQALDSILMQEVSFSYEILIHDDASTDGTTELVKEYENRYPDIIRCMYETTNQYSKGNLFANWDCLFGMCRGKYCAILEGDDYWTDSQKMQRQYSFMKAHPECMLYMHNAWRLDVCSGEMNLLNTFPQSGYYSQTEQVLCGLGSKFPAAASYFFVMNALRENFPEFIIEAGLGDYPMRQILANKGEVYYDERPMSVYRYLTGSSFMKNIHEKLDAYVTYILRMSTFYNCLNAYLDYQFDEIYSKKIDSDILGLAAATYKCKDAVPDIKDKWLATKLQFFYTILSGDGWIESVKEKINKDECVWIYGTSALAAICKQSLARSGVEIKGFVVSDGYSKLDSYEGCDVKYVSETKGQNDFYIIAAQPINTEGIEQILIDCGEKRYFAPYAMNKRKNQ